MANNELSLRIQRYQAKKIVDQARELLEIVRENGLGITAEKERRFPTLLTGLKPSSDPVQK